MASLAVASLAVASLAAAPLAAQERLEQMDLPRSVANEILEFFNRETTTRFHGAAEVPSGSVIEGDVGVLSGPFTVAGEVLGNVVVVNGDLEVLPGGRISGDVTVIGGRIVAEADAVGGQVAVYSEGLRVRSREGRITRDEAPWAGWRDRHHKGNAYISVRNEGSYNRVEGLPVMIGPVFRSEGEDFLRADVMAIWRSGSGVRLDSDELGYFIRAEQHQGPGDRKSVV